MAMEAIPFPVGSHGLWMLTCGRTEDYFTRRATVDVKELKENNPEFALLLDVKNGNPANSSLTYKQVPVQKLEVGSYILVRAGEAVPVDGEVYQGRSTVTVEHLTGESKPLEKKTGDCIPGGARNLDGMLIVKERARRVMETMCAKKEAGYSGLRSKMRFMPFP